MHTSNPTTAQRLHFIKKMNKSLINFVSQFVETESDFKGSTICDRDLYVMYLEDLSEDEQQTAPTQEEFTRQLKIFMPNFLTVKTNIKDIHSTTLFCYKINS